MFLADLEQLRQIKFFDTLCFGFLLFIAQAVRYIISAAFLRNSLFSIFNHYVCGKLNYPVADL